MMRDNAFPPDGGHGSEGVEKGVEIDIKPPPGGYTFTGGNPGAGISGDVAGSSSLSQHLKWQAHMVSSWIDLCDEALQDM